MSEEAHPEALAEGSSQAHSEPSPHKVYEVGFHIVPTVSEEEVPGVVEKIRAILKDSEIIKEQVPQKITLAYPVERSHAGKREKYVDSYFGWIKFAVAQETISTCIQGVRDMSEVFRFLVVETVREDVVSPRRAIFTSDRLEGQTLKKPTSTPEVPGEVSDEELDKSIEALVQ